MTTYAAARDELATALAGRYHEATGEGEPPLALILGNGGQPARLAAYAAEFRVLVVVPGQWSDGATSRALGAELTAVMDIVRGLQAWQLVSWSPDVIRDIAGGQYLTADVVCRRSVDF